MPAIGSICVSYNYMFILTLHEHFFEAFVFMFEEVLLSYFKIIIAL